MKRIAFLLLLCLVLAGCQRGRAYFPAAKEMTAQHVEVVRFDSALLVDGQTAEGIQRLFATYPTFMPLFTEDILGIAASDTAYLQEALPQFLNDTLYGFRQTNAREQEMFADIQDIQQSLDGAFTRLHYLYPDMPLPTIYLFISGFNASIYFAGEDIAVGADMYLGSEYEYYNRVVYVYQKQTLRK